MPQAEAGKSRGLDDEPRISIEEDESLVKNGESKDSGRKKDTTKKGKEQKEEVDQKKVGEALAPLKESAAKIEAHGRLSKGAKGHGEAQLKQAMVDKETDTQVFQDAKGEYVVVGRDFGKQSVEKLLKGLGLGDEIKLPEDWNHKDFWQKRRWLIEKGVEIAQAVGGGADGDEAEAKDWLEDLPDSSEVSSDLAPYVREIENVGRSTRSVEYKHDSLRNIEDSIRNAVLEGKLSGEAQEVQNVRQALEKGISNLAFRASSRVGEADMMEMGRRGSEFRHDRQFEIPTKEACDKLLNLAKEGKTSGAEWDEALNKIDSLLKGVEELVAMDKPSDFKKAYFIAKGLENAFYENAELTESLPGNIKNRIESVFEPDNGLLSRLDKKFNSQFNMMDKKRQHALVGDIDSNSTTYLKMISGGWGTTLEVAKGELLRMIGEDNTGFREWRVIKHIEGLEQSVRVKQSTEVIPIWKEIPEKLTTVFSQMESMDFSVEELGAAANEAITLVRSIAPDTPEGRSLRDDLVAQLEAFRAFHSFRITMERNDMNPEQMLSVFQQYFDDETWEKFADRFSRDDRFRKFVDAKGESANLFDNSFSLYSERLRQDRIKMNMVEELTKRAISNPLSDAEIRAIARSMNQEVTDTFRNDLERIRQYFVLKTQAYIDNPKNGISGSSVEDVWGRKNKIGDKYGIYVTHELIQEWHKKQTLQGAFGYFEKEDIDFLANGGFELLDEGDNIRRILDEKEVDLKNDDGRKKAEEILVGRSYLSLRQEELKKDLANQLKELGLQVRPDEGSEPIPVDIGTLDKGGFLDSVNKNAYFTTWMFEWSNYDSIRVYSRDTNSGLDDDFESLVFHQSTNMFWGRHIDHIWEFYHDTNENRGRPKENDVNRIWKQNLPGKHHYLFPQNSVMVRWTENFMSEDQKREINRRTEQMVRDWDFDNSKYHSEFVSWMRNVVIMDMIENGEVSMSMADNDKKFSEVVKAGKIKKFEMIDVFVDRNKHLKYAGPDAFQAYLANPGESIFIDINNKTKVFYSTRAARQFPWMTLATRAHWEVASKHRRRLFDAPNLTAADGENLIDTLEGRGDMERKQSEKEKRKFFGFNELAGAQFSEFLGTTPFRRIRQTLEYSRRLGWETTKGAPLLLVGAFFAGVWGGFVEFVKQFPRQVTGGGR